MKPVIEGIKPSRYQSCDWCVRYCIWVVFGSKLLFACDVHFERAEEECFDP